MPKNVIITVDDYLMRKNPEKYKTLLKPEKEDDTEKREWLAEIKKLEAENKRLKKVK
ncbi:MAG: hypothetical protein ACTSPI_00395 [Candidatus Heimdallarchaeaceae archaeon]